VLPPTNQLNGGIVQNDTTDSNAGLGQALQATSNIFANFNPTFTSNFNLLLTQPLLRGLLVDNTRQPLRVTSIDREISEIQLRGMVSTTMLAPAVYTLFEEGRKGLRKGAHG